MRHVEITRLFLDMCLDRCLLADVELNWADRYRKDVRQQALIIETLALTLRNLVRVAETVAVTSTTEGYQAVDNAKELLKGFEPWPDELKGQAGPPPEDKTGSEAETRP